MYDGDGDGDDDDDADDDCDDEGEPRSRPLLAFDVFGWCRPHSLSRV